MFKMLGLFTLVLALTVYLFGVSNKQFYRRVRLKPGWPERAQEQRLSVLLSH